MSKNQPKFDLMPSHGFWSGRLNVASVENRTADKLLGSASPTAHTIDLLMGAQPSPWSEAVRAQDFTAAALPLTDNKGGDAGNVRIHSGQPTGYPNLGKLKRDSIVLESVKAAGQAAGFWITETESTLLLVFHTEVAKDRLNMMRGFNKRLYFSFKAPQAGIEDINIGLIPESFLDDDPKALSPHLQWDKRGKSVIGTGYRSVMQPSVAYRETPLHRYFYIDYNTGKGYLIERSDYRDVRNCVTHCYLYGSAKEGIWSDTNTSTVVSVRDIWADSDNRQGDMDIVYDSVGGRTNEENAPNGLYRLGVIMANNAFAEDKSGNPLTPPAPYSIENSCAPEATTATSQEPLMKHGGWEIHGGYPEMAINNCPVTFPKYGDEFGTREIEFLGVKDKRLCVMLGRKAVTIKDPPESRVWNWLSAGYGGLDSGGTRDADGLPLAAWWNALWDYYKHREEEPQSKPHEYTAVFHYTSEKREGNFAWGWGSNFKLE